MNIVINKDFLNDYKDNFFKGFSKREAAALAIGAAAGIALAVTVHLAFGIDMKACVYIGLPPAAMVIILGFFRYKGVLPLAQLARAASYTRKCRRLAFEGDAPDGAVPDSGTFAMGAAGGTRGRIKRHNRAKATKGGRKNGNT